MDPKYCHKYIKIQSKLDKDTVTKRSQKWAQIHTTKRIKKRLNWTKIAIIGLIFVHIFLRQKCSLLSCGLKLLLQCLVEQLWSPLKSHNYCRHNSPLFSYFLCSSSAVFQNNYRCRRHTDKPLSIRIKRA